MELLKVYPPTTTALKVAIHILNSMDGGAVYDTFCRVSSGIADEWAKLIAYAALRTTYGTTLMQAEGFDSDAHAKAISLLSEYLSKAEANA